MPELGPYGSVRGARGNSRLYRDRGRIAGMAHERRSSGVASDQRLCKGDERSRMSALVDFFRPYGMVRKIDSRPPPQALEVTAAKRWQTPSTIPGPPGLDGTRTSSLRYIIRGSRPIGFKDFLRD